LHGFSFKLQKWTIKNLGGVSGLRGSGVQLSLIAGVVVIRYILLPVIGIVIVKGALYFGLVHEDPLYLFVLLLQYALPPAMNIGIVSSQFLTRKLTNSFGGDQLDHLWHFDQ